jgi:cation transporter-like permease
VVRTTTAVDVTTPEDDHDGVLPEPSRWMANLLWAFVVLTLCLAVLGLTGAIVLLAFVPAEPKSAVDAATIVALLGTVLASLVGFYAARQRR